MAWKSTVLAFMSIPVAMLMLPTFVLLTIALMPSILLAMLAPKSLLRIICVLSFNIAGTVPALFQLWFSIQNLETVWIVLAKTENIVYMYGSAALGLLCFFVVPPLVMITVKMSALKSIQAIDMQRQEIMDKWGEDVA